MYLEIARGLKWLSNAIIGFIHFYVQSIFKENYFLFCRAGLAKQYISKYSIGQEQKKRSPKKCFRYIHIGLLFVTRRIWDDFQTISLFSFLSFEFRLDLWKAAHNPLLQEHEDSLYVLLCTTQMICFHIISLIIIYVRQEKRIIQRRHELNLLN